MDGLFRLLTGESVPSFCKRASRSEVGLYGTDFFLCIRSEVVGRPLAALLANDGARVFSVDIDNIQEYDRRPSSMKTAPYMPRHVVRDSKLSLQDCLSSSDVVIAGVPSKEYKVKSEWLRDGVIAINVSSEKNFESDIKDKVMFRCKVRCPENG